MPDAAEAKRFVEWNETADRLAAKFWPGPLTLVLPRAKGSPIALLTTAGLDTVAIRAPAHPMALELMRAAGCPIAAPSANRSGAISPTRAEHVAELLGDARGADPRRWAVHRRASNSTVLDLTARAPTLLRPGGATREAIEAVIGRSPSAMPCRPATPRANLPASSQSHYAPARPVRLGATSVQPDEGLLAFGPSRLPGARLTLNLSPSGDLTEAAANLFAHLRALDRPEIARIAVMPIPQTGLGLAINDRLRRAAADDGSGRQG